MQASGREAVHGTSTPGGVPAEDAHVRCQGGVCLLNRCMSAESLHTRCQGGVWLLNLCILGAKGGVLGETVRPLTPGRFEACARNGLSSKKTCIPTHAIFGAGAKRGRMNSATVAPWGPGAG